MLDSTPAHTITNHYHPPRPDQKPSDLACGTPYQTLPDPVLAERNPLVVLVWSGSPLPFITTAQETRHTVRRPCVMWGLDGLELVVYGAVELGDVMLSFIGEQGLFGCEVLTRLVGHTD